MLKALTVLVKNVPKQMAGWLPQILPPVWATLTTSAEKYVREVVNEGGEEEDVVDSDGEVGLAICKSVNIHHEYALILCRCWVLRT